MEGKQQYRIKFKGVADPTRAHYIDETLSIASQSEQCSEVKHIVYINVSACPRACCRWHGCTDAACN